MSELSKKNALTDYQLKNMLKNCPQFSGVVCSKDRIPYPLPIGWVIINLQNNEDGNGTHWCCFRKMKGVLYYCDSFGIIAPKEIINLLEKEDKFYYNARELQDLNSTCCGYFCAALILSNNTSNINMDFHKFISQFSQNTRSNDLILKMMLFKLLHKSSGLI